MLIQKTSAYPATVGAFSRKDRIVIDQASQRSQTQDSLSDTLSARDHASGQSEKIVPGVAPESFDTHLLEKRGLSALNPKLDRRTQAAIERYETLQTQSDADQRESISKLLGIDFYV